MTFWGVEMGTLKSVMERVLNFCNNFPLYHLFVLPSIKIFGKNEFALRLPSVIFSVLSIIMVYQLGKVAFDSKVGFWSALIFSLSGIQIQIGQEARQYSLAILCALTSAYCYLNCFSKKSIFYLMGFIFFISLVPYAHYTYFPLMVAYVLHYLSVWVNGQTRAFTPKRFVFAGVIILFLMLPVIWHIFDIMPRVEHLGFIEAYQSEYFLRIFLRGDKLDQRFALWMICFIVFQFLFWKKDARQIQVNQSQKNCLLFLFSWWVVSSAILILLAMALKEPTLTILRYSYVFFLPHYFFVGFFLSHILVKKVRAVFAVFLIVFLLLPPPNNSRVAEDWRGSISSLKEHVRQGDLILFYSGLVEANLVVYSDKKEFKSINENALSSFYFDSKLKNKLEVIDLPFNGAENYIVKLLPFALESERFWLIGFGRNLDQWLDGKEGMGKFEKIFKKSFRQTELVLYERSKST